MDKEDEVQALRRELEQLRAQLDEQRGGHAEATARLDSPIKAVDGSFRAAKPQQTPNSRDPSPRHSSGVNSGTAASVARGVSFYGAGDRPQGRSLEIEYISHVPVDTKRGKWWLKDRQVLSRNLPAPDAEAMTVKVRETWLWTGRTVVVDKIVAVPTSRLDEDHAVSTTDVDDRKPLDVDTTNSTSNSQRSGSIAPEVFANSKQFAKEFMLPSPSKPGGQDSESSLTASARMEMEMVRAAAPTSGPDESTDITTLVQQASGPASGSAL